MSKYAGTSEATTTSGCCTYTVQPVVGMTARAASCASRCAVALGIVGVGVIHRGPGR